MSFQQWRSTKPNPLSTTGPQDKNLGGDSGSYALTGSAATLRRSAALAVASLALTVAGSDVAFARGRSLAAGSGSYSLTGSASTSRASRAVTAASGSYTTTGSAVTLARSRAIAAASGAVTVSGSAVTFSGSEFCSIGGAPVEVRDKSLTIQKAANGRATLDCEVLSCDGAYRPALGSELIIRLSGTTVFAGTVDHVSEAGLGGYGVAPIVNRISAVDFNGLADRRLLVSTRSSETTTARLSWIASELANVTLHASQAPGVTLPAQTYDYVRASDALKDIALANGADWIWRIDANKKLRVLASGTESAPFDIVTAGHAIGDVQVERSRETYRNAVSVRAGDGRAVVRTETFTANGGDTSFITAMPAVSDWEQTWPALLIVNGSSQGAVGWGYGYLPAGTAWYWDYATHSLVRDGGYSMTAGDVVTITYTAQYPFTVVAEDATEITAYGRVDELIERPDIIDYDAAVALADAQLAKRLLAATTVRYETRTAGLEVGQVQHITLTDRDLDDDVVITSVTITNEVGPTRLRYRVQAEAGQFTDTYQAIYERWSGQ